MGKANIVESLGDGKYTIEVIFDTRNTQLRLETLEEKLEDLEWKLLSDLLKEGNEYKTTELKILYIQKEINFYNNIPATEIRTAWCVDFSEEISGEVGTIETHGEAGLSPFHKIFVKPGYNEKYIYDPLTDGVLATVPEQVPEQWFVNTCFLPGWQKWQPMFRLGEILYIDTDNDKAHVQLDDAYSSQVVDGPKLQILTENNIIINNIPIKYMQCNANAFTVGDRVVVNFKEQSWEGAKEIVGFDENPQPCPVYLQVEINGEICKYTIGGKKVRIYQESLESGQMEQVGETQLVRTTDKAIAGPFPDVDLERPFYAQLNYKAPTWYLSRPLYWFHYYEIGNAQDYDLHLRHAYYEDSTLWLRNAEYKSHKNITNGDVYPQDTQGPGQGSRQIWAESFYLKRVQWMTSEEGNLQGRTPAAVDTSTFGKIRVYPVDFTCKVISHRHRGFQESDGGHYPTEVYSNCKAHGDYVRHYDPRCRFGYNAYGQPIYIDEEKWSYFAGFIGDIDDGCWENLPQNLNQGLPDVGFSPTVDIFDQWSLGGGLTGYVAGNSFLKFWEDSNPSVYPFIIALPDGTILSTPNDTVLRCANILQYNYGECYLVDGECPDPGWTLPCGDWKLFNDAERHTYEYRIVDLPKELI